MSTTKIGQAVIGNEMCDILKSDLTGRFAVCAPNQMTPNFYATQELAIENAKRISGESYELARKWIANGI